MTQLTTTLGTAVGALAAGGTVKVVQVLGAADFAPGTSSTPGSQLPRTGQDNLLLSALAALLIALGLGLRNWFVQPSRLDV
jgi:LPXTG-motif cell wall-anchored protein